MNQPILTCQIADGIGKAVSLSHELVDDQTVQQFRAELQGIVDAGASSIELDMARVNMVSSMAICAIITVDRQLKAKGGRLHLRAVQRFTLDIFNHMRLDELLDIEAPDDLTLVA
ncbi:MAG: STAS domain-containing protein [Planctomycetaceae bacterium]